MTTHAPPADSGHIACAPAPAVDKDEPHPQGAKGLAALGLTVGAVGVVFGDIGTSPLYAFRIALKQAARDGVTDGAVLGVVSLALWAMLLVVTVKYVLFLMRADNNGEGGVLSLMALAERAVKRRTRLIFFLGLGGAALFYGDAAITPAISILSAAEGIGSIPALSHLITPEVILVISLVVLIALFAVQARGTARIAAFFGPVMVVWFLALAALGLWHIAGAPQVLAALSPTYAVSFVAQHGLVGLLVLGSVFLTVTGAEALFADMGHFGRWPIQAGWIGFCLPCLALNYFGQGSMALEALAAAAAAGRKLGDVDWFFTMAPESLRVPMVILSMLATIIASQAVITGAFSLTQQAMQLGLLPRMSIRNTSEEHSGQIFMPTVNLALGVAVVVLVLVFRSSTALGDAYGLAVTGTMVVTTSLGFIVVRRAWKWPLAGALTLVAPLLALDLAFLAANALKIPQGGWLPLLIAFALALLITTWVRGSDLVTAAVREQSVPLADLLPMLARTRLRSPGTAVFLTSDADTAPAALLHNLKHNNVLHAQNLIVTVLMLRKPRVPDEERVTIEPLDERFKRVTIRYGFMERPDVPQALALSRATGERFDMMTTSFFLGRRSVLASRRSSLSLWRQSLYAFLTRNSSNPTDYFHIPVGRVVELGSQVAL